MYRAVELGQPTLFVCLKAQLRNVGVDWTTLDMQQLAHYIDLAISSHRVASKQKVADKATKDELAAVQAINEAAAKSNRGRGRGLSSSGRSRGGRGGRSGKGDVSNFRSRESNSWNVFGSHSKKDSEKFDDALPVSDAAMAAGECETCHSKEHISNKCPQQKIVCNNYKNFKTCSYADKPECRFRHLEADDVLTVQEMEEFAFSEQPVLSQLEVDVEPIGDDDGTELALTVQEAEDLFPDCLQGHEDLPDLCDELEAQFIFEEFGSEGDVDDALAVDEPAITITVNGADKSARALLLVLQQSGTDTEEETCG